MTPLVTAEEIAAILHGDPFGPAAHRRIAALVAERLAAREAEVRAEGTRNILLAGVATARAMLAEREACAQVAEDHECEACRVHAPCLEPIAADIRARKESQGAGAGDGFGSAGCECNDPREYANECPLRGHRAVAAKSLHSQVGRLATCIREHWPREITDGGACDVAIKTLTRLRAREARVQALVEAAREHLPRCDGPCCGEASGYHVSQWCEKCRALHSALAALEKA